MMGSTGIAILNLVQTGIRRNHWLELGGQSRTRKCWSLLAHFFCFLLTMNLLVFLQYLGIYLRSVDIVLNDQPSPKFNIILQVVKGINIAFKPNERYNSTVHKFPCFAMFTLVNVFFCTFWSLLNGKAFYWGCSKLPI